MGRVEGGGAGDRSRELKRGLNAEEGGAEDAEEDGEEG